METSREFLKAAVIAVALPLILVLIGAIMLARTSVPAATMRVIRLQQESAELEAELAEMVARRNAPKDDTPKENNGKKRSVAQIMQAQTEALKAQGERSRRDSTIRVTLQRMPAQLRAAQNEVWFQRLRASISVLAILIALAAGAFGMAGLGGTVVMVGKAKQSRDALVAVFSRWSKILPILLICQSAALVVSLAAVCSFIGAGAAMDESKGNGHLLVYSVLMAITVLGFGAVMVWRLFLSLRTVFDPEPGQIQGRVLDKVAAPRLWEYVGELARRVGTDAPDHIVMGLDGGFYVTSRDLVPSMGGMLLSGRTLHLPLPQLAFLDRDETAAIIGHELGHFTGEDLEYSDKFMPIYAGAAQSLQAITDTAQEGDRLLHTLVIKPLLAVAEFFFHAFDGAVKAWSRERELNADQAGLRVSSALASASALLRTSINAGAIHAPLAERWRNPDMAGGSLLEEMIGLARERGLDDPREHLGDRQPHPTDTHPSALIRIEGLGMSPDDSALIEYAARLPEYGKSVLSELLPGSDGLCAELVEDFRGLAQQRREETIAALEEAVAEGEAEAFEMHERTGLLVLGEIALLAILLLFSFSAKLSIGGQLCLWAVILLIAWAVQHFYKRGRLQPALVFTSTGIKSPGLTDELPWTAIEEYELTGDPTGRSISVELFLKDSAPAPERRKVPVKCKYVAKKHKISLMLLGLKKFDGRHININVIEEEMDRRLGAVHARTALGEIGKD